MSPHAELIQYLTDSLPASEWNIRNGDRPIDALTSKRVVVAYTSTIEPARRVKPSMVTAEISLIVFGRNTAVDRLEDELFEALTQLVGVLNNRSKTYTWSNARRGVWNDMPGYQLEAQVFYTIEKENN